MAGGPTARRSGVLELSVPQIREQLGLAVDRVMNEGSCYDPEFAALAIKQAAGDLVEAALLLRAYRTTLPRLGYTEPVETENMRIWRRISAIYKDLPGGQYGPDLRLQPPPAGFRVAGRRRTAAGRPNRTGRAVGCAAGPGHLGPGSSDPGGGTWRAGRKASPTSPVSRCGFRPAGRTGCKIWRGATRAFCSPWVARPSAASGGRIRSSASCGSAKSRSNSCPRNWASPSRSAR